MIFHFPIKTPAKGRVFWMERIQESVLVSTLKRRSALLTHPQIKGVESVMHPNRVAQPTGTSTVGLL